MRRLMAVIFSDLEQHSEVWSRTPQEQMVSIIAEYRYLSETLASQFGNAHRNFTGDGYLFLFESADAALQFALRLLDDWRSARALLMPNSSENALRLRIGCHFGECTQLDRGEAYVGRAINLAKRVEDSAAADALYVTENILELIDLPLYAFEDAGEFSLKGDHLSHRSLYRVLQFDGSALQSKPANQLTAEDWFLRGIGIIGTSDENGEREEESYRQALHLRPDYAEAHNNLAILLRRGGDATGAANHYREALRIRPTYPEAHYNYAILLASEGRSSGAIEHFTEAIRLRPEYVDAHYALANVLRLRGQSDEAERHYQAALKARPEYSEAHSNYAMLLEDAGRRAEAGEHYRTAVRISPEYAENHYNYALFLEAAGQPVDAERHYRDALALRADYPEAHNNLAVMLHSRGEFEDAEHHYGEALRLRPDDPEAHYNYGLLLAKKNDPRAQEHFRMAYELAPDVLAFKTAIE